MKIRKASNRKFRKRMILKKKVQSNNAKLQSRRWRVRELGNKKCKQVSGLTQVDQRCKVESEKVQIGNRKSAKRDVKVRMAGKKEPCLTLGAVNESRKAGSDSGESVIDRRIGYPFNKAVGAVSHRLWVNCFLP